MRKHQGHEGHQGHKGTTRTLIFFVSFVSFVSTGSPAIAAPVTYTKDIAPLLADRCAMCHHPSGSAPFSLLTYADVKRRATQIAGVTRRRFMPPWKADPDNGPFVGQHPLSDSEIARIQQWVDAGAIEGAGAD